MIQYKDYAKYTIEEAMKHIQADFIQTGATIISIESLSFLPSVHGMYKVRVWYKGKL